MEFTVILEWDPEEEVYNASVPVLPGAYSWGSTRREAMVNIKDAIVAYLEVAERHGDTIPVESELATVRV